MKLRSGVLDKYRRLHRKIERRWKSKRGFVPVIHSILGQGSTDIRNNFTRESCSVSKWTERRLLRFLSKFWLAWQMEENSSAGFGSLTSICGEKLSANSEAVHLFRSKFHKLLDKEIWTGRQVLNCKETGLNYKRQSAKKHYPQRLQSAASGYKRSKKRVTILASSNAFTKILLNFFHGMKLRDRPT